MTGSKIEKALKIIKFLEEKEKSKSDSSYWDTLIFGDLDDNIGEEYDPT